LVQRYYRSTCCDNITVDTVEGFAHYYPNLTGANRMLPPRPRFDARPAIARLQHDRTDVLRDMYPNLAWVWDELDELRRERDDRTDKLNGILDSVENRVGAVLLLIERLDPVDPNPMQEVRDELDELLGMIEDGRAEA
jgi:hypothetical protein